MENLLTVRTQELRRRLREAREGLGITQRDLAMRLAKPQSFISKFETGERRLDVIEYLAVCEAMLVDPLDLLGSVLEILPLAPSEALRSADEQRRPHGA